MKPVVSKQILNLHTSIKGWINVVSSNALKILPGFTPLQKQKGDSVLDIGLNLVFRSLASMDLSG